MWPKNALVGLPKITKHFSGAIAAGYNVQIRRSIEHDTIIWANEQFGVVVQDY